MESISVPKKSAFLGAVLIAAGTSIGAGMLALPILTGLAGFWPAIFIYAACWIIMTYSSFLLLEVNLTMGSEANLMTMAKETLGTTGKIVAFITYIFLFYSVSVAYLAVSGSLINHLLSAIFNLPFSNWVGIVLSLFIYVPALYCGTRVLTNTNSILTIGVVVSYVLLIVFGAHYIDTSLLKRSDWSYIWMGIPVIATSFTFQNVIPSLTTYLKRDLQSLKWVIILGGLIPLVVYVIWQWFVLGILQVEGPIGIRAMLSASQPATVALQTLLHNSPISLYSQVFSFCAIATSYLGVILSLFDFLADGFKIKKSGRGKILLCGFIFIPPVIMALLFPKIFLAALSYAGSFGCITLFVILPVFMAWSSRYKQKANRLYKLIGDKLALSCVLLIGLGVILVQLLMTFKVIKTI